MQFTLALAAAFAGLVAANPMPQGVTSNIAPSATAPAGCSSTYAGSFEITVVKPSTGGKRDILERQTASNCGQAGILTITSLRDGRLTDSQGRTGYIAANSQFQFDSPPQTGAIYTGGFSLCSNGSLAIGGSTTFYQCLSGTFYNLYSESQGGQCSPVAVNIIPCSGSSGNTTVSGITQSADGQPQATSAGSLTPVSVYTDGQPQATASAKTVAPVSVYTDGQPQATASATVAPVSVYSDGQPQATAAATSAKPVPVSVYSDGQPQATANATSLAVPSPTIATAGASLVGASAQMLAVAAGVAAFALL